MAFKIPDHDWPRRHVQDRGLKQYFGLSPKAKWPQEGMEARALPLQEGESRIGGTIIVWVATLTMERRGKLRALCTCPMCAKTMAVGRLPQHKCK